MMAKTMLAVATRGCLTERASLDCYRKVQPCSFKQDEELDNYLEYN
ncbi:MAG: hypothetical protein WC640_02280 [Candidatus Paceibacterota bacterium]|jgi:hypothetical protein